MPKQVAHNSGALVQSMSLNYRRAPQTIDDIFATLADEAANSKLVDGDCGGLSSR